MPILRACWFIEVHPPYVNYQLTNIEYLEIVNTLCRALRLTQYPIV